MFHKKISFSLSAMQSVQFVSCQCNELPKSVCNSIVNPIPRKTGIHAIAGQRIRTTCIWSESDWWTNCKTSSVDGIHYPEWKVQVRRLTHCKL